MKHILPLLLAALLLLAAGCAKQSTPDTPDEQPSAAETKPADENDSDAAPVKPESADEPYVMDGESAVYAFDGIQLALPAKYLDAMIIETDFPAADESDTPLLCAYEKASVEAAEEDYGDGAGFGFLFGIVAMNQAGFEQAMMNDIPGCTVFARKGDTYYARTFPTDVQFYRSGGTIDINSEDWQTWEILNTLGDEVCDDMIARNALTPYNHSELYSRPYTWDGAHARVEYNPSDSSAEPCTIFLSQPVRQGEGGLWCVERVLDSYGTTHLIFPENGMAAMDYYVQLQTECDAGRHPELLSPLSAATTYAASTPWLFGSISVGDLTLEDDSDDSSNAIAEMPRPVDMLPRDAFPAEFCFSSGAGAWRTFLTLNPDGSFEGAYTDSDMGDNGPDYPNGTLYICIFSGRFTDMKQLDNYTYSLTLDELTCEKEAGTIWIEDGVQHVASGPYGLEDGREFLLYTPAMRTEHLDEEFLFWWPYRWEETPPEILTSYGLLNISTGHGFFT